MFTYHEGGRHEGGHHEASTTKASITAKASITKVGTVTAITKNTILPNNTPRTRFREREAGDKKRFPNALPSGLVANDNWNQ